MTDYISRYAENSAAMYNAAFQRLEDRAIAIGNNLELIGTDTLTVAVSEIALPSTSGFVLLNLEVSAASTSTPATPCLRANGDAGSLSYYYALVTTNAGGVNGLPSFNSGSVLTAGTASLPGYTNLWIIPTPIGYLTLGNGSPQSVASTDNRSGSIYAQGAVTSLSLAFTAVGKMYDVGTRWILRGIRA